MGEKGQYKDNCDMMLISVCLRSDGELPVDLLELDTASLTWHTATTGRLRQGRQGHVALRIPCSFHATQKPKFHKLLEMP